MTKHSRISLHTTKSFLHMTLPPIPHICTRKSFTLSTSVKPIKITYVFMIIVLIWVRVVKEKWVFANLHSDTAVICIVQRYSMILRTAYWHGFLSSLLQRAWTDRPWWVYRVDLGLAYPPPPPPTQGFCFILSFKIRVGIPVASGLWYYSQILFWRNYKCGARVFTSSLRIRTENLPDEKEFSDFLCATTWIIFPSLGSYWSEYIGCGKSIKFEDKLLLCGFPIDQHKIYIICL